MQNESRFTTFSADNCAREPIHIPGSIQSHGLFLGLRSSDLTILQVSANVYELLGKHHDEVLHQPLSSLMDVKPVEDATHRLGERMPRLLNPIPIELLARGQKQKFDGILHRSGRTLILELEPHIASNEGYGGFGGFYEAIREVATRLMNAESIDEVMSIGCEEIRKLTGFERVLSYKFDEDWNGTVIAESKAPLVSSLLHHRFPSTDIPKQARDLYTINWLRIIPDVNYKPSPIVPSTNPITDKPTDLSNSVLRSVSSVHLEYMRNMGQAASMSISLLRQKKLWGLISCHNSKPRFLKYDSRVACEFIGQMISAQIVARDEGSDINHAAQLKTLFASLTGVTRDLGAVFNILRQQGPQLLNLTDSQGVALCTPAGVYAIGACPTNDELDQIRTAIIQKNDRLMYTTSIGSLVKLTPDLRRKAAGILALVPSPGYEVVWFRPEMTEHILWSGNPELSKEISSDGSLRPRRSFETWLENVEGRSRHWRQPEIDAAAEFLEVLLKYPDAVFAQDSGSAESDAFRSALATSMQRTADTKLEREPDRRTRDRASTISSAAENSRFLLEGFSEFSVLFLNTDGEIQNWSAGAKRLLGYNSQQVIGRKIDLFLSDDEIAKEKHQRILEFVRTHERCEEEIWLYRHDATSFWAKIMVAAVRDDQQNLIGYSIVIQDITKEKSAEEELKATKIAAEAANQAKTAFLANISHEIRTPLGAVLGFAELLRSDDASDADKENLYQRIRRNGEQLTSLINDLLDLTKVEANRLEVEVVEFDVSSLLLDISETFGVKASEKSVALEFKIDGRIPRIIHGDPTRIRQILVNLLSNSIKFTPPGGKVTVSASLSMAQGKRLLELRVEDTGRGMNEEQMSKLFQPFVQADVSTTRKYGGTGLGLFISQRLARLLGGDVSIERSRLGEGSIFLASIDIGNVVNSSTFTQLSTPSKSEPLNALLNKELHQAAILVVDDSPDNRHLITMYLEKAGALVDVADNGRVGVTKALAGDYDLVLMDIQMPVLDGNAAMRELRELNYQTPVIALTAHAMIEERSNSLQMGFRDYLTKPISRDILVRKIRDLIDLDPVKSPDL